MSFETISITRQIPIINGMVIVPDSIPITLNQALQVSGISITPELTFAKYIETLPGIIECCDDPLANEIAEEVKSLTTPVISYINQY